mmetsp:Transcript_99864/g.282661  ORF Transcript_99864/g.282661 Transcript_99864/m.282661 type:complete len:242 (-) Transcript_99864:270-995(-)
MNLLESTESQWFSQQHPLTTWHSCSTRRPEPMIGACEKQKTCQPSESGCFAMMSSNHSSCFLSMETSWDVYCAVRNAVDPSPTRSVFSATSWQNCGVSLPKIRKYASKFCSSVPNSSMPSRSWLPPTTSHLAPKPSRYSRASLKQSVVPEKSCFVWLQSFDSPRSPSETTKGRGTPFKAAFTCSRPSYECSRSRGSKCKSPKMPTVNADGSSSESSSSGGGASSSFGTAAAMRSGCRALRL